MGNKYKSFFIGIPSRWKKLLLYNSEMLFNILDYVIDEEKKGRIILPSKKLVFNFARYELDRIHTVIIGQDPYFKREIKPHGLSFSSLANRCPASLRRIFSALINQGLITNVPSHFNLESWCRQGVLLLNTALTVEEMNAGSHSNKWHPYTRSLINIISIYFQSKRKNINWCLWGSHAKSFRTNIEYGNIMEWCHPVSPSVPSFPNCTHFNEIKIHWNIDRESEPIEWFTDGACYNNHDPSKAIGAWGYYNYNTETHYGGVVNEVKIDYKDSKISARPTNIRAEGLALYFCMRTIYRSGVNGEHIIYTDSKFWIDMLYKYIPSWSVNNVNFTDKKNSDIVKKIWPVFVKLNNLPNTDFVIKFVNAWHDLKGDARHTKTAIGNKNAEMAAQSILDRKQ
jgi:uracil-DNA glycosylase